MKTRTVDPGCSPEHARHIVEYWGGLLEAVGISIDELTPWQIYDLGGVIINDKTALSVVHGLERHGAAIGSRDDFIEAVKGMPEVERLALRDRVLGVRQIR